MDFEFYLTVYAEAIRYYMPAVPVLLPATSFANTGMNHQPAEEPKTRGDSPLKGKYPIGSQGQKMALIPHPKAERRTKKKFPRGKNGGKYRRKTRDSVKNFWASE